MNLIPTWVRRLWDVWDLRVLVLLSFTLQLILSIFGNRRKSTSSLWISVLVWSAYLLADWVATVALSKLSDVQGDPEKSNILWAIWAPLLLLHLGGPDTITAYSLEDNQLWLRHLLGLVVQLFVAIYVILMSWKNSWFSFMSLPALVAGFIKYGERTWVLKPSRKIIRSVLGRDYENKWNRYQHKTSYSVHPLIYNTILDSHSKARRETGISDLITAKEFDEFWDILEERSDSTAESDLDTANESVEFEQILQGGYNRTAQSLQEKIWHLHLATQICYHLENEWDHDTAGCSDSSSSSSSSKEVFYFTSPSNKTTSPRVFFEAKFSIKLS